MDAKLVKKLLRCVQSADDRVRTSAALEKFCAEHPTVGYRQGGFFCMRPADKATIARLLSNEGVDPATPPDAWKSLSRADALGLGKDEKLAQQAVKRHRIAVKPLRPGMPIDIGTGPIVLPMRCHLDLEYEQVSPGSTHDWLVVVENWETFNDIHLAADRLAFPGDAPLIVWRGDASATRADAMLAWIGGLRLPVAAFADFDPAGLLIAANLPRLQHFVAPPADELRELLRTRGLHERFQTQLPGTHQALDLVSQQGIRAWWELIRAEGKALPQEYFVQG